MPVITAITQQRRHETRFSVAVDGKYAFSVSDLDLSGSNLRVGSELTEAEVADWQAQAGSSKAYNQALRYIGLRSRSRREVETYLKRKDYDGETIAGAIGRLEALGLINDIEFAAAWVRERRLLRPRSLKALRFELMKLGVGKDAIEAAVGEPADEAGAAHELALKKQRQYPDEQKLMAYLARQGFSYDNIKQALARLKESQDDD